MGNVYIFEVISPNEIKDVTEGGSNGGDKFIVHGGVWADKAEQMIEDGKTTKEVAKMFCGYCGGYVRPTDELCIIKPCKYAEHSGCNKCEPGCGCDNSQPQMLDKPPQVHIIQMG